MAKVLIVGAGGVGSVVAHKCSQFSDLFSEIMLASRTLDKCRQIRQSIQTRFNRNIQIAELDADNVEATVRLIREYQPQIVLNMALPYQDLPIMDACLETGVDYLDTANYEPPHEAKFEYRWQWAYHDRYQEKGIIALLGAGFDPGVTNVFCAFAKKHHFDEIESVDIIDCNAGDHGKPFATNFNPEINIREITQKGRFWENGQWKEIEPMSVSRIFTFPEGIGPKKIYLLYHEEMESLSKHFAPFGLKRMRFWMTFSERYINYLRVLQDVGMTSIKPVVFEGTEIIPLQFLKALLPDPSSLGATTHGKTCIGCLIQGKKAGKSRTYFVYNICDHEVCYQEVGSQAISYTAGVPPVVAAEVILRGLWNKPGVYNMEQFDPDPFMELLPKYGLPWVEISSPELLKDAVDVLGKE